MKKAIIFVALLFMIIGAVAASEDINSSDDSDAISISDDNDIQLSDDSQETLKQSEDVELIGNESSTDSTPETPTVTTSAVKGTAGKTITLKASVKNSTGAVSGVTVTFKLNGNTYSAVSDSNGIASVNVKCPASKALETTTKYNSKKLTKTTTYSKDYTATASIDGASNNFKVTSTNKKVVKYKVSKKKTKTVTIKLKKGIKAYKKGNYAIATYKHNKGKYTYLETAVYGKYEDNFIKFFIKGHSKQNGKWKWDKWFKIPKAHEYYGHWAKSLKVDKIKVKYTQVTYKRI